MGVSVGMPSIWSHTLKRTKWSYSTKADFTQGNYGAPLYLLNVTYACNLPTLQKAIDDHKDEPESFDFRF